MTVRKTAQERGAAAGTIETYGIEFCIAPASYVIMHATRSDKTLELTKVEVAFMLEIERTILKPQRSTHFRLRDGGNTMTYASVIRHWEEDETFCRLFNDLLAESDFAGFRWETPPLTARNVDRPFEFVLLNANEFASRRSELATFHEFYSQDDNDQGIVSFANLRGDAQLVVPSPRTEEDVYGHLAAFVRGAPPSQQLALWRVVARTVRANLSDNPLWLSTAGGGVAWLHVRLDTKPKYYGHSPYRSH